MGLVNFYLQRSKDTQMSHRQLGPLKHMGTHYLQFPPEEIQTSSQSGNTLRCIQSIVESCPHFCFFFQHKGWVTHHIWTVDGDKVPTHQRNSSPKNEHEVILTPMLFQTFMTDFCGTQKMMFWEISSVFCP